MSFSVTSFPLIGFTSCEALAKIAQFVHLQAHTGELLNAPDLSYCEGNSNFFPFFRSS